MRMAHAKPVYFRSTSPPHITTLILVAGIGAIPLNMFLPTLPDMADYFDAPIEAMQFAVTGYLILTSLAQLIIGPISDRYGRRPVMCIALVSFILASLGAAMSESFLTFMVFRCLQAAIVSGFILSRAAVRDTVSRDDAASKIGYVTMGMALVPMLTPPIGGLLGEAFGWQSNFYFMAAAASGVLAIVYFDMGETNQTKSASFTAQFEAYPELIKSRRFWGYAICASFGSGMYFAYLSGAPFVGDMHYNLSAAQVGIFMGFPPIGYLFGNWITARWTKRFGLVRMMMFGATISLILMLFPLVLVNMGVNHPLGFYAFAIGIGFGNGFVMPTSQTGLMDINPELAGSAAGLGGALMTMGGALLSALTGFVLTETSGPTPLILCIVICAICSLIAASFTARIEQEVRG